MLTIEKPFLALTADDLMTRHVEVLPQHMSLRAAAHRLSQDHISGAPVVDSEGRCVGVLSATDFVHWADHDQQAEKGQPSQPVGVCSDWEVVDPADLPVDEVRCHMTADLVTVDRHARITDLARMMLDAHIHRVIVVDKMRRPVGIVTSTDILAAVASRPQ